MRKFVEVFKHSIFDLCDGCENCCHCPARDTCCDPGTCCHADCDMSCAGFMMQDECK